MTTQKTPKRTRRTRGTQAGHVKRQDEATPLLNERLRAHGKWIFLVLAIILGVSFGAGVIGTSSGSSMFSDFLNQQSAKNSVTKTAPAQSSAITAALAKTQAQPSSAAAWIALGDAYSSNAAGSTANADQGFSKAASAYAQAVKLDPKNAAALKAQAEAWSSAAAAAQASAIRLQAQAQALSAGLVNTQALDIGGDAAASPFDKATNADLQAKISAIYQQLQPSSTAQQTAAVNAANAWQALAQATPNDPVAWFKLANAQSGAQRYAAAIAAFQHFIKLVPNDPTVPRVQQVIKQLQGLLKQKPATVTTTTR